jgi:hypothetical protein
MSYEAEFFRNLKQYAEGPARLRKTVDKLPAEVLDWRPVKPADAWTIREHVIHIVDSDVSGFFRWRMSLAEPGAKAPVQEEELWNSKIEHARESMGDFLNLHELLRKITVSYLEKTSWDIINVAHYQHPVNGRVALSKWVQIYAEHVDFHIEYIDRNYRLWKEIK